jgi:mannose-6-phosphate isomerase
LDRTREVLDGHFHRADGSFSDRMSRTFEDLVPERRSQNPHMHLLEAALSLAGKGQGEAEADLARRLLELFRGAFHDAGNAVVLEHLGLDFAPHGTDGHRVEPGHHFEWAWLLDWASRTLGETSYREMAMPILASGLSSGWDQDHGGVFDEVDRRDGGVLMSTKRIWPLLELIKALAVFPNSSAEVSLLGAVDLMLDRYLTDDGRWTERFNADWTPAEQTMPASTAYHISTALTELERVVSKGPGVVLSD